MSDDQNSASVNPLSQLSSNPWALVILAVLGGGGVGTVSNFVPGLDPEASASARIETALDPNNPQSLESRLTQYVGSTNAALADIRTELQRQELARDERHEQDHLMLRCKWGQVPGMTCNDTARTPSPITPPADEE